MQERPFGPAQLDVGVIGQGSWNIDYDDWDTVVAALRRGIEPGLTHIDTAELYGDGVVEKMVAEAIAGRRDEVFLVSKLMPENATRRGTIRACERTLERLDTDSLDCYLLDWPEDDLSLDETFEVFDRLLRAGKIRSWGVSNFDVADLEAAPRTPGPAASSTIRCSTIFGSATSSMGSCRGASHTGRGDGVQPVRAWSLPGTGPAGL